MSNPGKVAEGEKLMKAAEKLCAPSVLSLRFKPEWEQACPLFERAAVAFKAGKAWLPAISALERAAQAQERQGSPWHAGKALESCAACAKEAGDAQRIVDFSHRAAEMFIEAGRPLQGADSLRKGAQLLESTDPIRALDLGCEGLDMLEENQDSGPRNPDMYLEVINMAVRSKDWGRAVVLLLRFGEFCHNTNAHTSMAKCYLGAVVIQLYAGEAREAWATFQDVLGVDAFMTSSAAQAADRLFDAYRTCDADQVRDCVKSNPPFQHGLDNAIGRLAKKLPVGDLEKQGRELGGAYAQVLNMGDGVAAELDEDDLT
eukprot:CAMPEP_0117672696 /NCGR_PEP_ID=MMETSP0804-20121206/14053_1 /TAXON_ID=1074897 /ORGANISM="Tetraselmis astigmatica, Strain CCMP880" /LENGTH=315 /DNA_ID=CAMNT_0005481337 /DNA_START=75 /DNA_END=1022 /DNA_ORIENTATION=-